MPCWGYAAEDDVARVLGADPPNRVEGVADALGVSTVSLWALIVDLEAAGYIEPATVH